MSVRIRFHLQNTPLARVALVGAVCPAWRRVCICSARGGERIETA
jgi:hypothetical protein